MFSSASFDRFSSSRGSIRIVLPFHAHEKYSSEFANFSISYSFVSLCAKIGAPIMNVLSLALAYSSTNIRKSRSGRAIIFHACECSSSSTIVLKWREAPSIEMFQQQELHVLI